jgi:hypothetical protein
MPKRKTEGYRLREGDQVPTRPVTWKEIMQAPVFALGVADARAALPFRQEYDRWSGSQQWNYERGRAWAALVPRHIAVRLRNGKLNRNALALGELGAIKKWIL